LKKKRREFSFSVHTDLLEAALNFIVFNAHFFGAILEICMSNPFVWLIR